MGMALAGSSSKYRVAPSRGRALGLGLAAVGRGDAAVVVVSVVVCPIKPHPVTARASTPLAVAISSRRNPARLARCTKKCQATGER